MLNVKKKIENIFKKYLITNKGMILIEYSENDC